MSERYGGLPTELSWKIFIDRYTIKDQQRRFQVGDLAVVQTNDDPKWPKKELAKVIRVDRQSEQMEVELLTGPEAGKIVQRRFWEADRPLETSLRQVAERIAKGLAAVEPDDETRQKWEKVFADEITALRVVPGGRVWAGAGTGIPLTLFNCYVIPNPKDSRQGIVETLGHMIEIMSRGGGVGINVSSLRPYRAVVKGVNGRSSGAVSWMELYSLATGLVEQGGCFGPEERIATDKGLIPAAELYERLGTGERIYAQTHQGLCPITARFANGTKKLYRVTTANGLTVEVTAEHKMGVIRDGEITTVPLADLAPGDEILTLLGDPLPCDPIPLLPVNAGTNDGLAAEFPGYLTPQLAYILGVWFGSGSETPEAMKFAVSNDQPELQERIVAWSRVLFGIDPVVESRDGNKRWLALYSRSLVEWLKQNGLQRGNSAAVRVPEPVFRSGYDVMGAFVAGYFDVNSAPGGDGGYCFDDPNLGMLRDIQQLLMANGIAAKITDSGGKQHGPGHTYRLVVDGEEFALRLAGFASLSLKLGDLSYYLLPSRAVVPLSGGALTGSAYEPEISVRAMSVTTVQRTTRIIPDKITSIEPSKTCEVYDFEVAGVHMLSGNGIYTSNSRRGALMLQLDIRHPDWKRFIDCKKVPGKVENANISLRITDDFMQAVKEDRDWTFWFPDTTHPDYDKIWDGDFDDWKRRGLPIVEYETLPARKVWEEIIKAAWESAEPGIVFSSRHESDSNSWYFNRLVCTNPCAEQPLPAWGVCTLGHVNLARMYDENKHDVNWDQLRHSIITLVRLLDNVIDATPYFIKENQENQLRERRIGAGTLGLGELLIRLELRYGSPEAVEFTDRLYRFIAVEAYKASVQLAKEKGPFPAFDAEKYLQSGFMRRMPEEVRELVRKHGIRNVTVLTQAPTGTVGTMLDTSTGIEPFYSLQFYRQSRLGKDLQHVRVAQEWLDKHPGQELPDYFVGAMDLTPEEHIAMQAAIQRWTDSSISKTANAPADYTLEETAELYMKAYDLGCKGVTVYRDRSRHEQVLHDATASSQSTGAATGQGQPVNGTWGKIRPIARPARLEGVTIRKQTPLGNLYVTINSFDQKPFELFAQIGKAGSDVSAFTEAIARLASLAFRCGVDPETVVEELAAIGGSSSFGFGPKRVRSVPDAIAQALEEYLRGQPDDDPVALKVQGQTSVFDPANGDADIGVASNGVKLSYNLCPKCGSHAYVYQEGCSSCMACGHSEC